VIIVNDGNAQVFVVDVDVGVDVDVDVDERLDAEEVVVAETDVSIADCGCCGCDGDVCMLCDRNDAREGNDGNEGAEFIETGVKACDKVCGDDWSG